MNIEKRINLLSKIVSGLADTALSGFYPHTKCQYCSGYCDGYSDSRSFKHDHDCIVLLIEQLDSDMRDEQTEE